ncbi:CRISPR-associated endonuclease Cas2 [Kroppenstedtia eburnea]|uniref:CRISPR-associated endonuclease Cas2 n=1 Tax=Kroppenstedtia eburnea TaxID=714067 RepID=UPI003645814C
MRPIKRIVSYDICNNRRRNKVFQLLKDHGQWIQYSVFEIDCEEKDWVQLEFLLKGLIKENDSLCVYTLCQSCLKRAYYTGELRFRLEEEQNHIL